MRRFLMLGMASVVVAATAGVATAADRPIVRPDHAPVTLPGSVTNKGTRTAKGDRVVIEQHDLWFEPTFVKAEPGTTMTVRVENTGRLVHTFTVPGQAADVVLGPGARASVKVVVPTDGAVMFYCRFHGLPGANGGSGMEGAIFTSVGARVTNAPKPGDEPVKGTVKVSGTKFGAVLVDSEERTLYLKDSDSPKRVTCTKSCAKTWPPLVVKRPPTPGCPCVDPAKLGTLRGPNGTQVTYAGHPLYRYAKDTAPGDVNGEGVAGSWVVDESGNKVTKVPTPSTIGPRS